MPSQLEYLRDTVRLLWPTADITSGRRPSAERAGVVRSYAVVPRMADPKLLVPVSPARTASHALRGYNTGAPSRQRAVLTMMAAGLRIGLGSVYPYRIHVASPPAADDIEKHLSEVCARDVRVSVFITPPRAVRKPVLQMFDERGHTVGYAKLGVDDFTRSLIDAEAAAARRVGQAQLGSLRAPTVLHHAEWRGYRLLVQSAHPRGKPAHSESAEVARAADELARGFGVVTSPLASSDYFRELRRRVDALGRGSLVDRVRRSVDLLAASAGSVPVEFGSSHGDWAPWNMTIDDGGQLLVWDWEKFACGIPVGFDTIHFLVQEAVVLMGVDTVEAFARASARGPQLLAAHHVSRASADLMVWIYATEIAVRYLEDRESDLGRTRMSRMTEWLDAVLSTQETHRAAALDSR